MQVSVCILINEKNIHAAEEEKNDQQRLMDNLCKQAHESNWMNNTDLGVLGNY